MNYEKYYRKNQANSENRPTFTVGEDTGWLDFLGIKKDSDGEITYNMCLKILSETMGKIPFKFYQETKENGIIKPALTDTARLLTERPNEFYTPTVFWTVVELNRLHYGNAYVYIEDEPVIDRGRIINYKIKNLWVMPSANVQVKIDTDGIFGGAKGDIRYEYMDEYTHLMYSLPSYKVLHFKSSSTYDGLVGKPMRSIIKETIDGAFESQNFMNKMYENNLTASGYIEYNGDVTDDNMVKRANVFYKGLKGNENIGKIGYLPPGLKYTPINIKPTDAQFFELRNYTALQIAGCFGVKPTQINNYDKASYTSSEAQNLAFLTDTVLWTISQYEQEINYKLLSEKERKQGYKFKMNQNVLLRVDSKTQSEIVRGYVSSGIYNVNNALDLLDLPHVEGGDLNFVNGTNLPLRDIGKQYNYDTEGKEEGTGNEQDFRVQE